MKPSKTIIEDIKETFQARKVYQVRWVWYHTIMVFELLLIIFLLSGILIKL
jgi:hypothetical protein